MNNFDLNAPGDGYGVWLGVVAFFMIDDADAKDAMKDLSESSS